MSMFSIFSVSGSAISAQSQRLNVVASNLANVDAVAGPDRVPDCTHGTRRLCRREGQGHHRRQHPRPPRAQP